MLAEREISELTAELQATQNSVAAISRKLLMSPASTAASMEHYKLWAVEEMGNLEKTLSNAVSKSISKGTELPPGPGQQDTPSPPHPESKAPTPDNSMHNPPRSRPTSGNKLADRGVQQAQTKFKYKPASVNFPDNAVSSVPPVNLISTLPTPTKRMSIVSLLATDEMKAIIKIHQKADELVLSILKEDSNAVNLGEELVQAIGSWVEGSIGAAKETLDGLEAMASNQSEIDLVATVTELLEDSEPDVPANLKDILNKLDGALELARTQMEAGASSAGLLYQSAPPPAINVKNVPVKPALAAPPVLSTKSSGGYGSILPRGKSQKWVPPPGSKDVKIPAPLNRNLSGRFGGNVAQVEIKDVIPVVPVVPVPTTWKERAVERGRIRKAIEEAKERMATRHKASKYILFMEVGTQTAFDLDLTDEIMNESDDDSVQVDEFGSFVGQLVQELDTMSDSSSIEGDAVSLETSDKVKQALTNRKNRPAKAKKEMSSKNLVVEKTTSNLALSSSGDIDTSPRTADLSVPDDGPYRKNSNPLSQRKSKRNNVDKRSNSQLIQRRASTAKKSLELLPPFFLVYLSGSGELELSPGVVLCTRVDLPPPPSPPLPRGLWLIRRDDGAPFVHEIEEAPSLDRALPGPLPDPLPVGLTAVWLPAMIPLQKGLSFVPGVDFGPLLDLPPGVIVVRKEEGSSFLPGMVPVPLSPKFELSQGYIVPPGLKIVQMDSTLPLPPLVMDESGVEISQGVESAAVPEGTTMPLPSGVALVRLEEGAVLPKNLKEIHVEGERGELIVQNHLSAGPVVVKRPTGLELPLGMELVQIPTDCPLPVGMTIAPPSTLPPGLKLPPRVFVVQLEPKIEYAPGLFLAPQIEVFPKPPFIRFPKNVILVQRGLGADIPQGFRPAPMPYMPHSVVGHMPQGVEALEIMHGAHLSPGTELGPGIVVAEGPPDIRLPMGVEIVRRQAWAECPPGTNC